jgi:hypothetical protein
MMYEFQPVVQLGAELLTMLLLILFVRALCALLL